MVEQSQSAIILAGGELGEGFCKDHLPSVDVVIAADGGFRHAEPLGIKVDVLVGDFDSIEQALFLRARNNKVDVRQHPSAKNETDFELALDVALELRCKHITVIGAVGGTRIDHELGIIFAMFHERLDDVNICLVAGNQLLYPMRSVCELRGSKDAFVSLLPMTPDVRVRKSEGLLWSLDNLALPFGSSLGISNQFTGNAASIEMESGCLLVVQSCH